MGFKFSQIAKYSGVVFNEYSKGAPKLITTVLKLQENCITGNPSWLLVVFPRHKNNIVENIWCAAVTFKIYRFLAVRLGQPDDLWQVSH
jgi:hypothetical protein